jgi:hypothetical protein
MGYSFGPYTFTDIGNVVQWGIEGTPLRMFIDGSTQKFYGCKNGSFYSYSDQGADYFLDFCQRVDVKLQSAEEGAKVAFWGVTNSVGDFNSIGDQDFIYIALENDGSNKMVIVERYNNSDYSQSYTISLSTWYYLSIQKNGTSLTVNVYSDAERTSLLCSLSLTLHSDYHGRYFFSGSTFFTNKNDNKTLLFYLQNLDEVECIDWENVQYDGYIESTLTPKWLSTKYDGYENTNIDVNFANLKYDGYTYTTESA